MISVKVYTRANVLIDQIPDAIKPKFQVALNLPGSGSMSVPATSVALTRHPTLLADGNIVKMTENGETFAWLIDKRNTKLISEGENDDVWVIAGRGVLDLLSDAVVYPELLTAQAQHLPIGSDRWFTFVAADSGWYDASLWATPSVVVWAADSVVARVAKPVNWPDPAASWMWDTSPTAHCNADTVWFRNTLTLSTTERFDVSAVGDDGYSLFIDGQLLMSGSGVDKYQTLRVILAAGEHVFAIQGTNGVAGEAGANPAGVMMTLIEVDTVEHAVRLHSSSSGWKCVSGNSAPEDLPGFNPGEVVTDLLAEAVARGVDSLIPVTTTWTADLDSAGLPWPDKKVNRAFGIGAKLSYVVSQLSEQMVFVKMSSDLVLSINAWDAGTDRTTGDAPVILRKANNVKSLDYASDGSGVTSAVLTLRNSEATDGTDPTAEAAYGRRESFVSLGNTYSETQAAAIRDWVFEQRGTPSESFTIAITPVPGAIPFTDFGVGDYVLAPGVDGVEASFRVAAISVETDEAGNVDYVPELSSFFDEKAIRQARWLASMADGTMGGDVRSASPTHQAFVLTSGDLNSANTTRYEQSVSLGPVNNPYVFYLESFPIVQSETVYRNGLKQIPDADYVRAGKVISMSDVIASDDEMTAHYAYNVIQPAVVEYQIAAGVDNTVDGTNYGSVTPAPIEVAVSSNGRWQVIATRSSGSANVYISADGLSWSQLTTTNGPTNVRTSYFQAAVDDNGKVYVWDNYYDPDAEDGSGQGWNNLYTYQGGDWSVEHRWWGYNGSTPTAIMTSGPYVYTLTSQFQNPTNVQAYSSDYGVGWTDSDTAVLTNLWPVTTPLALSGIGHRVHDVYGYQRYLFASNTLGTTSVPPTMGGRAFILPKLNTPGTIYIARLPGSAVYVSVSTDYGDNWTDYSSWSLPAGMTSTGVTMGSDGLLHLFGYTAADGTVTIKESHRNPDGTGSWSALSTKATHEGTSLVSVHRSYPDDHSIPMETCYVVVSIQNGSSADLWVVNES